jgi:hypothetical protein
MTGPLGLRAETLHHRVIVGVVGADTTERGFSRLRVLQTAPDRRDGPSLQGFHGGLLLADDGRHLPDR